MIIASDVDVRLGLDVVWEYLLDGEKISRHAGRRADGDRRRHDVEGSRYRQDRPGVARLRRGRSRWRSATANYRIAPKGQGPKGQGSEERGKGAASVTITSTLEQAYGMTTVKEVIQDLKVQGQAAQVGRGMMQDVSAKLTRRSVDCLGENVHAKDTAAVETLRPQVTADRVGGVRLALGARGPALVCVLRRLFRDD